jgi:hypothetical protein
MESSRERADESAIRAPGDSRKNDDGGAPEYSKGMFGAGAQPSQRADLDD